MFGDCIVGDESVFVHKTRMKLDILDNMKLDILDKRN